MTELNAAPDRIPIERILEIIQRDPMGALMVRAAVAEATCEIYQQRVDQLERQQNPAGS